MAEGIFGVHFLSFLLFKTYLKIYEPLLLCITFVVKMFFFYFGFDVEKKGITLESRVSSVLLYILNKFWLGVYIKGSTRGREIYVFAPVKFLFLSICSNHRLSNRYSYLASQIFPERLI